MAVILAMIIIPIIAFAAILFTDAWYSRKIALLSTAINLAIVLGILVSSLLAGSASLTEKYQYIGSLGINLGLRINAISLALLVMSSVVLFTTVLSGNVEKEHAKLSNALIALFQVSAIGLFTSTNLLFFFIFWDVGVIALFFMINILGSANRKAASINFLIYEVFASSLLLLGILMIYFYTPVHSFDIQYIAANASSMHSNIQSIIFLLFLIAFMTNMPLFPMHFWLPDAHTEASTQGSMLLSGILTKFGGFGMLMLFSMLPVASRYSVYIAALALVSAFYSVFLLMRQKDLKRIIAYSTIVEMGIVMVGIASSNSIGTYGAVYAMLSHGLVVALMFLLVGVMKHVFGERSILVLKGTVAEAPAATYAFLIGVLAMIGFPLTSGFVADIMLFIGSFQAFGAYGLVPLAALILLGAYMYLVVSKSMLDTRESSDIVNFSTIEHGIGYALLGSFIFLYGIIPFVMLSLVKL